VRCETQAAFHRPRRSEALRQRRTGPPEEVKPPRSRTHPVAQAGQPHESPFEGGFRGMLSQVLSIEDAGNRSPKRNIPRLARGFARRPLRKGDGGDRFSGAFSRILVLSVFKGDWDLRRDAAATSPGKRAGTANEVRLIRACFVGAAPHRVLLKRSCDATRLARLGRDAAARIPPFPPPQARG
jgi:hypothetical protein